MFLCNKISHIQMFIRYCINYIQLFDSSSEKSNLLETENKFDIYITYIS